MDPIKYAQVSLLTNSHERANASKTQQRRARTSQLRAVHDKAEAKNASIQNQRAERETKQMIGMFGTALIGEPVGTLVSTGARADKVEQDKRAANADIDRQRASADYEDAVDSESAAQQLEDGARAFLNEITQKETEKSERR